MELSIGLCQLRPVPGRPEENAASIVSRMGDADVLVLPEMFLTGYGAPLDGLEERMSIAVDGILDACRETDSAVAVGAPVWDSGIYNSLLFVSPDGITRYDKAHLARFGPYSEDGFAAGKGPSMGTFRGLRFGMCVCYDVFFPEILHGCSLRGASVNLCCAASAMPSEPFFDTILPARALENVTYLAFVNNVGPMNGLEMYGRSRGYSPLGRETVSCGRSEGMAVMTMDTDELEEARRTRRHLEDFRSDAEWIPRGEHREKY